MRPSQCRLINSPITRLGSLKMRYLVIGLMAAVTAGPAMAADPLTADQRAQLEAIMNMPYPGAGATGQDVNRYLVAKATACERLRPYLKRLKTETSFMHCVFDGYADSWRAAGAPNLDLAEQLVTGEFAIADQL